MSDERPVVREETGDGEYVRPDRQKMTDRVAEQAYDGAPGDVRGLYILVEWDGGDITVAAAGRNAWLLKGREALTWLVKYGEIDTEAVKKLFDDEGAANGK